MSIEQYADFAAPTATVTVALLGLAAGRWAGTRRNRELKQLSELHALFDATKPGTPGRAALGTQLEYEAKLFARRHGGRSSSSVAFDYAILAFLFTATIGFGLLMRAGWPLIVDDRSLFLLTAAPLALCGFGTLAYAGRAATGRDQLASNGQEFLGSKTWRVVASIGAIVVVVACSLFARAAAADLEEEVTSSVEPVTNP